MPLRFSRLYVSFILVSVFHATAQTPRRIAPEQTGPVNPASRVALVIGNNAYPTMPLQNAVNDARAMATALKESAFEVIEVEDADREKMDEAVSGFLRRLSKGGVGLFYYSGHAMQIGGENYLAPVDLKVQNDAQARSRSLNAGEVLAQMQSSGTDLQIVILDACRNNPFGTGRSAAQGLAQMTAGNGSYIAYATAPGSTADDNRQGLNGLYTAELLKALRQPLMKLEDVFKQTSAAVQAASGGRQIPWRATNFNGDFYFRDLAVEDRLSASNKEEIQRLEQEVRTAAAERARADDERRRTEAKVRQDQAQARLHLAELETERLERERQRTVELQAERERMKAEELALAKKREEERLAAAAKLNDLRKQRQNDIANPAGPELTLEQARLRVAALQKQLEDVQKPIDAARKQAIKRLESDYTSLRAQLRKDPKKGELETTAQFQARVADLQSQRDGLEARLDTERRAIELKYDTEIRNQPLAAEIERLRTRTYASSEPARWVRYDADAQRLLVAAGKEQFLFPILLEKIQDLSTRKESLQLLTQRPFEAGGSQPVTWQLMDSVTGEKIALTASGGATHPAGQAAGQTWQNPKDGVTYSWIPAGTFMMGCLGKFNDCPDDELPAHQVTITKGFWIGRTEVTQEAYQKITGTNPSGTLNRTAGQWEALGPDFPVNKVNWEQARRYCEITGMRLPTEAEWEWAARAGSSEPTYGPPNDISWNSKNTGQGSASHTPQPVARKKPNAWGLYDMPGNAEEWVADWMGRYLASAQTDPLGPASGKKHVLRGCSTLCDVPTVFSRDTEWILGKENIGFRCAGN